MENQANSKVILTAADVFGIDDIQIEAVPVPEWQPDPKLKSKTFLYVKGLSGTERDVFESKIVETKGKNTRVNMKNVRAKLVAESTYSDPECKNKTFADKDIISLGKKSALVLSRLFDTASRLSGISDRDVEELAEGLEQNPFEDSPLD